MELNLELADLLPKIREHGDARVVFVDGAGRTDISFSNFADLVDNKLALLTSAKLAARSRVGLLGGNSIDFMAWDVALLASGHVPIVFAEEHVKSSQRDLIAKYSCALLVAEAPEAGVPGAMGLRQDTLPERLPAPATAPLDSRDTLTLVFSSGTTGRMKGLIISRIGTEHILGQFIKAYQLTRKDKYYSFLPFSYFQQRALYFTSLYMGINTIVVPPKEFLKHFQAEAPTYTINPPVFYESIFNYVRTLERLGHTMSLKQVLGGQIRWMITAMAPIRREVLDFFWGAGVALHETYGVTETGIVAWNTLEDFKVGTVGKPASDGEIILTDANEVLIKRAKPLALGYFDVAEEDAREVFRSDGSVTTGDIASVDNDGYITLVGRSKSAIVTPQGKKFHPEELERLVEKAVPGWVPVVVGGAGVCPNTLLLAPSTEAIAADAGKLNLARSIHELNQQHENHKHIQAAFLLKKPLSIADGYLTRNFKLDRKTIEKALIGGTFNDGQVSTKMTE